MQKLQCFAVNNRLFVFFDNTKKNVKILNYGIYRYGKLIANVSSDSNSITYTIKNDGLYAVKCQYEIQSIVHSCFSYPVSSFCEFTKNNFDKYLAKNTSVYSNEIKLADLAYPYRYLCVVFIKRRKYNFNALSISGILKRRILVGNDIYYTFSNCECFDNFLFSGVLKVKDKLIFGEKEYKKTNKVYKNIGFFNCFNIYKNKTVYCNDYFGLSKSFYFEDDDVFIVSNQMHLLLQLLKCLQIKVTFQLDYVKSCLCNRHFLFFQQNYSSNTFFKEISILKPFNYITFHNGKIRFMNTPLYNDLKIKKGGANKFLYDIYLNKAKKEIIDNVACVLNNKMIVNKIFDLTGGIDSRLCVAALSNINNYSKKCSLRTIKGVNSSDLIISKNIASLLGLNYFKLKEVNYDFNETRNLKLSLYMGGYYKSFPINYEAYAFDYNTIICGGGFGEAVTRHFVSERLKTDIDFSEDMSKEEYCDRFLRSLSFDWFSTYFCDYDTSIRHLSSFFLEEFCDVNCENKEALESFYLRFRAPFHLKQTEFLCSYWAPLQSKYLYRLFRMSENDDDLKLSFDLLYKLNKQMLCIPFANRSYNEELKRCYGNNFMQLNENLNFKNLDYDKEKPDTEPYISVDSYYYDEFYKIIPQLCNYIPQLKEFLFQLWFYSKNLRTNDIFFKWQTAKLQLVLELFRFSK